MSLALSKSENTNVHFPAMSVGYQGVVSPVRINNTVHSAISSGGVLQCPAFSEMGRVRVAERPRDEEWFEANLFKRLFDFKLADTPALKAEAHRIRFQVFCVEQGFEDPANFSTGMERDSFDDFAEHAVLIYKPTEQVVGTVRVVFPREEEWQSSFPIQSAYGDSQTLQDPAFVMRSGEISRFSFSSQLMKDMRAHAENDLGLSADEKARLNRVMAMASVGLIGGAYELLLKKGRLDYCAAMTPALLRACLGRQRVPYERICEDRVYHGVRTAFRGNILEAYDNMREHNPVAYEIVTRGGHNYARAQAFANRLGRCAAAQPAEHHRPLTVHKLAAVRSGSLSLRMHHASFEDDVFACCA